MEKALGEWGVGRRVPFTRKFVRFYFVKIVLW